MNRPLGLALAVFVGLSLSACGLGRSSEPAAPVEVTATLAPELAAALTPRATRVPAAVPVVAAVGRTPTLVAAASPAPVATPVARLVAEPASVAPGGCTLLRWTVSGARKVRLIGKPVKAQGSLEVCPAQDTTYYLWFEGQDGRAGEAKVAVTVARAIAASDATLAPGETERDRRAGDGGASLGPPTATECVGTECAVIEPPTETPRPTRRRPTTAPTEEPKPTDEPPTAEPPATEKPKPTALPTEEPTALPTDEPKPTVAPTEEPQPTAAPTEEPTKRPPGR